jgi:hypothetical protein
MYRVNPASPDQNASQIDPRKFGPAIPDFPDQIRDKVTSISFSCNVNWCFFEIRELDKEVVEEVAEMVCGLLSRAHLGATHSIAMPRKPGVHRRVDEEQVADGVP